MPTLKLSQQKALAGEAVTCGLTVESLVSVKQAQETEWQLHGYAVPVPLFLGSLGPLLIPAIAGNWWGPGSAHKVRVALVLSVPSLAPSVALMEAISMSLQCSVK